MKVTSQDNISNKKERILFLIAELNSTLDLYYENLNENDYSSTEK